MPVTVEPSLTSPPLQLRSQPRRPRTRSIPLILSSENLGSVVVARVTLAGGREILFGNLYGITASSILI